MDGSLISYAFTVWQEEEDGVHGGFVVNLSEKSEYWPKGSLRMENISGVSDERERVQTHEIGSDNERLVHLQILCKVLSVWNTSVRVGKVAYVAHKADERLRTVCANLRVPCFGLFRRLYHRTVGLWGGIIQAGLLQSCEENIYTLGQTRNEPERQEICLGRNPNIGTSGSGDRLSEYGVHSSSKDKVKKVKRMTSQLLKEMRMGRRWVNREIVSSLCGVCLSLSLEMPWARLYNRSLYWDMTNSKTNLRGSCKLSHQSI